MQYFPPPLVSGSQGNMPMNASDLAQRTQVLQAELRTLRRQVQYSASGATVHRLVNKMAIAHGALGLLTAQGAAAPADELDALLVLAEESIHAVRTLMAQA